MYQINVAHLKFAQCHMSNISTKPKRTKKEKEEEQYWRLSAAN